MGKLSFYAQGIGGTFRILVVDHGWEVCVLRQCLQYRIKLLFSLLKPQRSRS